MSGHSKWSQIKHKKALVDAKKGRIFSKLGRAIAVAARDNPDPNKNLRLKGEIERARAMNMPNDTIDRAIKRFTDKSSAQLSEIQLEYIGPGNASIIVLAITDNTNRTINELKLIATKLGARPAGQGALLWRFKRLGVVRLPANTSEAVQLKAIDAGAEDVRVDTDGVTVYTSPELLDHIRASIAIPTESFGVEFVPIIPTQIHTPAEQEHLQKILEAFDDHDDVQDVFTDADY
jgi:YebC/PmpR family DNA-binding regulatory protein